MDRDTHSVTSTVMANERAGDRWAIEQVVALARTAARFGAAEALAVPSRWSHTGAGDRGLWGRYHGSAAEPYEVAVDHVHVRHRCTCPSRVVPCKHVVGLLVLWVRGHVASVVEPPAVTAWIERESRRHDDDGGGAVTAGAESNDDTSPERSSDDVTLVGDASPDPDADRPGSPVATTDADPDRSRNERVERLVGGLVELDRWLEDRIRVGLSDPSIARFATWDELANRLVDARAGALANRVRRLAGRVGASPDWHEHVLAELGVLHLIAQAGQRIRELPRDLADAVAVSCGWQVKKADVEASAPETDRWLVTGRSDTREDLVEVRRVWLQGLDGRPPDEGQAAGRTAMVLSFAAYRQSLDDSLTVGSVVHADVHRYPGSTHRVLVGDIHGVDREPAASSAAAAAIATTVAGAFDVIGRALAAEPWLDRVPATITASPTRGDRAWLLSDHTGSLVIAPEADRRSDTVATLLAASAGAPVTVTVEWTATGVVPLAVFIADRTLDIGPRADPSFVSAA